MTVDLKRARILARLQGIDFKVRELVDEWLLVTYDLPSTPEGNEVRSKFLKLAPQIGAVMHTRSVYLMPLTNETQAAAVELSKIGNVFVWTSKANDQQFARQLTRLYDSRIENSIDTINSRIKKILVHIDKGHFKRASSMYDKTVDKFNDAVFSAIQRGNGSIYNELCTLRSSLDTLKSDVGE